MGEDWDFLILGSAGIVQEGSRGMDRIRQKSRYQISLTSGIWGRASEEMVRKWRYRRILDFFGKLFLLPHWRWV